jgi:tetratricopeptide (TPR) repeat protein
MALQIAGSMSAVVEPNAEALIRRGLSTDVVSLALYREALTVMNPPFDRSRVMSAQLMFNRLRTSDPSFPGGAAGVGFTHAIAVMSRWSPDPAEDLKISFTMAREAIELDDGFAMGHATLGFTHALAGNSELALEAAAASLARQPGDALVQFLAGMVRSILRQHVESIPYFEEALRLDPIEPRSPNLNGLGIAYIATGESEQGVALLERNIERGGPYGAVHDSYRALAYADLGRMDDARAALDAALVGPNPIEPVVLFTGLYGPGEELDHAVELLMALGYTPPS